jgi:phage terminase large subunit-like protein
MLSLRLGEHPQMVITTTPKRVRLVRELVEPEDPNYREGFAVTRGSTYDNIDNLAETFLHTILRYEGSQIGRQEILGELLREVEGALWTADIIELFRLKAERAEGATQKRVVVGVDPQGGAVGTGGLTGIVAAAKVDPCVCGRDNTPHALVLEDGSISATPKGWAQRVLEVFDNNKGDLIVPERNFGGQMVEDTIKTERSTAPVKMVVASRGKAVRAEPISALYESGRIHHVGAFPELEDELTGWTPDDTWSPNRLDALVWALTELDLAVPVYRARSRRARTAVA